MSMNRLVLLSGGMDSVAALYWALERTPSVRAVFFDYGQPQRDTEAMCAGEAARTAGVELETLVLAEAVRGLRTLSPPERGSDRGVSRANMPARNAIMLSCAAARAAQH